MAFPLALYWSPFHPILFPDTKPRHFVTTVACHSLVDLRCDADEADQHSGLVIDQSLPLKVCGICHVSGDGAETE